MNLEHLQHFVALAEDMHFGRAAERLGIGQPQLTRSIQKLEHYLRVKLIDRTTRTMSLTPAGQAYRTEARKLVAGLELARRLAQQTAAMGTVSLRIGFIAAAMYLLPRVLQEFRRQWPQVDLALEQRSTIELAEGLRDGSLDVALLGAVQDAQGLQIRRVTRCGFVALVPKDWSIAQRTNVSLEDLSDYPFVLTPYDRDPSVHSAIMTACRETGFVPKVIHETAQPNAINAMIAAGVGITLQPEVYQAMHMEGIAFVPIAPLPSYLCWELSIAWIKPYGPSAVLDDFIERIVCAGTNNVLAMIKS